MSSTSHRTGADTTADAAAPAEAHGVGNLAETTTVRSADSDAQTRIAKMEAMWQCLLPETPVMASRVQSGPAQRDWNTKVCLSCGKSGHAVSQCPELNETFPYMLPVWSTEKVGGIYGMVSPLVAAE